MTFFFFVAALFGAAHLLIQSVEVQPMPERCLTLDDFSQPQRFPWQSLNDGVMGGRSSGEGQLLGGQLIFSGVINTNGGGFASLRRQLPSGVLSNASHFRLRVRPDSRQYRLILRSNQTYFGRSVSYQVDIPKTPPGRWSHVDVPLSALSPSIFGRRVPAGRFAADRAVSLGIIIADALDGPFEIRLKTITACSPPPASSP
jgi:NADH dehydrogenase [ubiquinone] 1 alpha subcomplex assembly factor 1